MDKDEIKETLKKLEEGVVNVFKGDEFENYLKTMSKFYRYSVNNCILIHSQMPDATQVASFTSWKNDFKRNVKKGEKGIRILAPITKTVERETDKVDEYGNVIYEKVNIIRFKYAYVFDVSQTEGKELDAPLKLLDSDVENYNMFYDAISSISEYDIGFEKIRGSVNGYCNNQRKIIRIKEGLSPAHTLKTLIHEISHEKLHSSTDDDKSRSDKEIEAEASAYVICSHFGIDSSDYSFGYVATWSMDKKPEELRKVLDNIKYYSMSMINQIEDNIANIKSKEAINYAQIEKDILTASNECLADSYFPGNAINSYIYNKKEINQDIRMRVICKKADFDQIMICKNTTTEKLDNLINSDNEYQYLNTYLYENGIKTMLAPTDENYDCTFDMDNMDFVVGKKQMKLDALVELDGNEVNMGKEESAFKVLKNIVCINGCEVNVNPIVPDDRLLNDSYTERIEKYEELGYDSSWPMVTITYSNILEIKPATLSSMNIHEAVKYIDSLDERIVDDPTKYLKIKISCVFNDWKYEHVQDIDFSKGRLNFIDYLNLPSKIISHLKSHESILAFEDMAKNFAPDTTYGQDFYENALEWGSYCRMELNHNSDNPVVPKPPRIDNMFKKDSEIDWRLSR